MIPDEDSYVDLCNVQPDEYYISNHFQKILINVAKRVTLSQSTRRTKARDSTAAATNKDRDNSNSSTNGLVLTNETIKGILVQ